MDADLKQHLEEMEARLRSDGERMEARLRSNTGYGSASAFHYRER